MIFNKHSALEGRHAFLGASKYSWINYDAEQLETAYMRFQAAQRGTELHEFACMCIRLGQRLPRNRQTLNMYVNDAIGFKMTPEQPLYYSENCFGTADTIAFRDDILRIHDFKSGVVPAHMEQLIIYAALFCLEYGVRPMDIHTELRIYQSNEVVVSKPTPDDILPVMDKIVHFDKIIKSMTAQEA